MKAINYLRGVTKIEVSGCLEEVINRVSSENILLWSAVGEDGTVKFYIHTKNVRRILALYPDAKIAGRGIPEKLKLVRKRACLVVFALVLTCVWVLSGLLVWDFQVTGNETVSEYDIIRVLRENGVDYASWGFLIDSEKLSNVVLCEIPQLSWFAVNVRGSRAVISVRERVKAPEIIDPNEQHSVYAAKSGLVTEVQVYDGTKMVSVGEEVEEGDLLVSGITASFTGARSENAQARIYAQTAYEFSAEMPIKCSVKTYTGQETVRYAVSICGRGFGNFRKVSMENYERHEESRNLTVFGETLPVKIVTTRFYEYELYEGVLSADECAAVLKDELSQMLRLENTGDVLWSEFAFEDKGETVAFTLKARCLERIG